MIVKIVNWEQWIIGIMLPVFSGYYPLTTGSFAKISSLSLPFKLPIHYVTNSYSFFFNPQITIIILSKYPSSPSRYLPGYSEDIPELYLTYTWVIPDLRPTYSIVSPYLRYGYS